MIGRIFAKRIPRAVLPASEYLLTEARFRLLLAKERQRSDRSGSPFSVLAMELSSFAPELVHRVNARMQQRLRISDEAGWLDGERLGIFLPDTPAAGAWKVAADLAELLDEDDCLLRFAVYVYPTGPQDMQPPPPAEDEQVPETSNRPVLGVEQLFTCATPAWKRVMDIAGGLLGITVSAPFLVAAAVAIKLTSPGPVWFAQKRRGRGNTVFTMYKLRTMRDGADAEKAALRDQSEQDGPAFKLRDDPRMTPVGRVLRKLSIDEFPQFWNVLWGDMSLVGPRPLPVEEADACLGWQRRRLEVLPGLTCIWQVHGRSRVLFDDWMRMDLRYVGRSTGLAGLVHDLTLLVKTLPAVFLKRGF